MSYLVHHGFRDFRQDFLVFHDRHGTARLSIPRSLLGDAGFRALCLRARVYIDHNWLF